MSFASNGSNTKTATAIANAVAKRFNQILSPGRTMSGVCHKESVGFKLRWNACELKFRETRLSRGWIAQRLLDRTSDTRRQPMYGRFRRRLHHHACQRLSAGLAYVDAAVSVQLAFSSADYRLHFGNLVQRALFPHTDVLDRLGKDLQTRHQLRQRLAAAGNNLKHAQRGEQAVAC